MCRTQAWRVAQAFGANVKTPHKDLTTGEITRYCQVAHFTVSTWIKAGKLRAYRTPGGHHRVRQDDFLAFLTTYRLPVPEEFAAQPAPRILVVDDDQAVVDLLTQVLRQENYQVQAAADGYEAGLQMATFRPHLLVLDLVMPRVNGLDLCARVKREPLTQGVKIIAMTAYVEEGQMEQALAVGADVCLEKPFRLEPLLQEVHRLLYQGSTRGGEISGLERRKTRRVNLTLPIHYSLQVRQGKRSEQIVGKGKTINVGQGGLLLETILPLTPSALLQLEIYLHREKRPVRALGEVRWVKRGTDLTQQVGVEFTALSEEARGRLLAELFKDERSTR